MTDNIDPKPAVAVSPTDRSSDRAQSDQDNAAAVASQTSASSERAASRSQAVENQAITVDRLDRLIEAADRQTASNEDLALAAVEYQERARLARKRFRITIIALIAATAVVLAVLAVLLSKMNRNLSDGARARDQIQSCVVPTGTCYQEAQRRTGQAIGSIQKIIVLAAACAPTYVTLPVPERTAAIERCIEKGLK